MKSNNLKYPKINNPISNRLISEEITRKSKSKTEESCKISRTPLLSNKMVVPTSPYSKGSPSMRSPIILKTPSKILRSPYQKCLQSPKTPRSPYEIKSPYVLQSPYSNKKDPWIYKPTNAEKYTKIIGVDEYGNLTKLPTVDYDLSQPDRCKIEETDGSDDYIVIGDIFLDQKNSKGKGYNYVSENMKNISLRTNELRSLYANKFKQYNKNTKGKVNFQQYEDLLEIYENNQVYYQDCIQNGSMTYDQLCVSITELEHWFICIVEPYNYEDFDEDEYDEWKNRELFKLKKGYSGYCDPELYFYIQQPLPQNIINYIHFSHKDIFIR